MISASAASLPFLIDLCSACSIVRQVIRALVIGFLYEIEILIIASKVLLQIKSKWGVSPLITHPKAKNPSYFFIFLINANGISKVPGTVIIETLCL